MEKNEPTLYTDLDLRGKGKRQNVNISDHSFFCVFCLIYSDRKKIVFFIPSRIRSPFLLPACISVVAVIHRLLLLSPASIRDT